MSHFSDGVVLSQNALKRTETLLAFLNAWVDAKQLHHPDAFGITLRNLAQGLGCSVETARRRLDLAAENGRIVIHDRGAQGPRGLAFIVGIVRDGETPRAVLERGAKCPEVKRRFAQRSKYAQRGAPARVLLEDAAKKSVSV